MEQVSFNFMAAVTVCSDFEAQENKICHCFHFSSIYLQWNDGETYMQVRKQQLELDMEQQTASK